MSSVFPKNLFYVPEISRNDEQVIIEGQEARHISKVLRYNVGDVITVANGTGARCNCEIVQITKNNVTAEIIDQKKVSIPLIKKVMAFGAIKTRDRLEFAIEKAVELGAWEICIFDSDHSERSRINEERVHTQIISAFKQSCRYFLPKLIIKDSLESVLAQYRDYKPRIAYVGDDVQSETPGELDDPLNLLLVGPEGGFSDREVELCKKNNAQFIDLGKNRLRAETAVAAFLSYYLHSG